VSLSPGRVIYFLREALQNVRHSPMLALVSVLTIAVSLVLVGFFGWLLAHGDALLGRMGQQLRLSVYLEPNVAADRAEQLRTEFAARPEVGEVHFLTAEQDRRRNEKLLSQDLIAGLDPASIPGQPTFDLALSPNVRGQADVDTFATWAQGLREVSGVQDVQFAVEKYRFLYALIDIFRLVGGLVGSIVLFASVFFVFATIKIAVYARAEEIEVLKLVGATTPFIRAPFYIEGALQGLLGSAVALVALGAIVAKVQHYVAVEKAIRFDGDIVSAGLLMWFVVGGIALGLLGSAFSVGRHLRS
jgi:cell division transport system permease protein